LVFCAVLFAGPSATGRAEVVQVATAEQLKAAIGKAMPGDIITLLPGLYTTDRLSIGRAGTAERPITVQAPALGDVKIVPSGDIAFNVAAPYWVFENLDIAGGSLTDHGFHIVGAASHVTIRHNFLHDLNAMVKGNGEGSPVVFPNDVTIEDNVLLDTVPRQGSAPVTPIDVVGGKRWVVRNNFIADFGKTGGNGISYGAFLKGNSTDGLFEHNLVLCEWRTHGGVRIGLSLGGGGTGEGLCDGGSCATEHRNGIIRSNIVANCPEDVGIYLNKAQNTKVLNNTLFDTNGIDVRFPVSSAQIDGNIISGGVRARDGGVVQSGDNHLFGTSSATVEHKALVWLEDEIMSTAKQHPNLMHDSWARWLAGRGGPVDAADELIGNSFLARDGAGIEAVLENPRKGNFALKPDIDNVAAAPAPDVPDDFCGYPRDAQHPSAGAIELRDENCYVPLVLLRAESLIVKDRQW
jgi:hypothetical protein